MTAINCKTVGELRAALNDFPDDMPLWSTGVDSGGYDAIDCPFVEVEERDAANDDECKGLFVGGTDDSRKGDS